MTDSDRDLIIKEIKVLNGTPCGDSSKIESESNQDLSGATVNRSTNFGWNRANQRPDSKYTCITVSSKLKLIQSCIYIKIFIISILVSLYGQVHLTHCDTYLES